MDSIAMTEQELQTLREELGELESDGRARMAARIKTAREWGDLKENGEYHAAKEAQAHLETRILRLRQQVRAAVVVEAGGPRDAVARGEIAHGSTVTVTDVSTERSRTFTIVSPNDARPAEGMLSASSPIAQGLIGHRVGEIVPVQTPRGERRFRVDSVG